LAGRRAGFVAGVVAERGGEAAIRARQEAPDPASRHTQIHRTPSGHHPVVVWRGDDGGAGALLGFAQPHRIGIIVLEGGEIAGAGGYTAHKNIRAV